MQAFPHHYHARAIAAPEGTVQLDTPDVAALTTAAPPEFDGPGGYWSPETLLVGAVADCFILSFRAVARASKFDWEDLAVDVEGVLERADGVTRFTHFTVKPQLSIGAAADEAKALQLLEKAERICLVSNSLSAHIELEPAVLITA